MLFFRACLFLLLVSFLGCSPYAEQKQLIIDGPQKASLQPDNCNYIFEKLGTPCVSGVGIRLVTSTTDGKNIAWAKVRAPEQHKVIGVEIDTGNLIEIDLMRFGHSNLEMVSPRAPWLYIYTGSPGRFLKYNYQTHQLEDLGTGGIDNIYYFGHILTPNGKFYVGAYPDAKLVCCDIATDKVTAIERLPSDPRQKYLLRPVADDGGVIYCPVGMHHMELWAYNPGTKTKKQILPPELTAKQGCPRLWKAEDGQVYGSAADVNFICAATHVELGRYATPVEDYETRMFDSTLAQEILPNGNLVLRHLPVNSEYNVQTKFRGVGVPIYSVACLHDNKLYGGTISRSRLFSYDLQTGRLTDYGKQTAGEIQIYDILSYKNKLFLSSYTGGNIDFIEIDKLLPHNSCYRHIVSLYDEYLQERVPHLTLGPDNMIYTGTIPAKGHHGGALVRIDPECLEYKAWPNLVSNQSIMSVTHIPDTEQLLVTTAIRGGSSSIPTEKQAKVFIWDTEEQKITSEITPSSGLSSFDMAVASHAGIIYILSVGSHQYFALDAIDKKVLHKGYIPRGGVHFPYLHDKPVGTRGLIYGLVGDCIYTIEPIGHKVEIIARHRSINNAHGFYVTDDGTVYYGSGSSLWRAKPANGN